MMMSGSWRSTDRRPRAKVSSVLGFTWICPTPESSYSMGSSMVITFFTSESIRLRAAYRVVLLPLPVGPRDQKDPAAPVDEAPEQGQDLLAHAHLAQTQQRDPLVQEPQHDPLPEGHGDDGDADIHGPVRDPHLHAAVLGHAFFRDVQGRP